MNFLTPRDVYFGWNSASAISELKGKIAVITGKSVWKNVSEFLDIGAEVYAMERKGANGEPHQEDVDSVDEFLKEAKPEWIVAVGGGSVIDSAKLGWVKYENPSITWEQIYARNIPVLREKARFVAVETTSGTGTGISAAAVVADDNGIKHGVVSPHLIPDMSIYDPNFVLSMPKSVAVFSGMDALTHAVESYVSNVDNIVADTLSFKAIQVIFENIKSSVMGVVESRGLMHYASMMAAMGFTNSRLGLCHAAAHKIGGRYGIEHGKVNAILLPHFIRATEKYTERFNDIARMLGVEDFARAVDELNRYFGIPKHIPELDTLEILADEIMADPLMQFNPGKMSREEVIEFLKNVKGD